MTDQGTAGGVPESSGNTWPSPIDIGSLPWAFTQHQPIDTANLVREAERRGVTLDFSTLGEPYKYRLLTPLVYVNNRAVGPIPDPVEGEPNLTRGSVANTWRS